LSSLLPYLILFTIKKPNIKRRFADDDPSDDDDDDGDSDSEEEYQVPMRGGGKGLRMPGGKGMGKQLRHVQNPDDEDSDDDDDDSDDDDDDDSDEEVVDDDEPVRPSAVSQGGGKQLRPSGGKQLRPP